MLKLQLRNRFEMSQIKLDPLRLYAYFIDKKLYAVHADGFEYEFFRP